MTTTLKPLIGITTSEEPNTVSWGAPLVTQNVQYPNAVLGAGGLPVLLPFVQNLQDLRDLYERLDGILLSGGGDVDPTEYGEQPGPILKDVSAERDRIELQLVKWAIADDKPVLAICRGYQILNVALGGTLIQDIPSEIPGAQNHDLSTEKGDRHLLAHRLLLDPDSKLAAILGSHSIGTNTHHHQAIKMPAPGLKVTGRAEDGIIECVELAGSHFVIGVQSHPESLTQLNLGWEKLFASFVEAAGEHYSLESPRKSFNTDVVEAIETL